MELLEHWDRQLFLFLNGLHTPWLDEVMWVFSQQWFGIPFYLFFVWILYKSQGWKGALAGLIACVLTVALANTITSEILKEWTGRYRPTHNFEIGHLVHTVNDYRGGLYSFCSSHAANMFGIATVVFLLGRKSYPKIICFLLIWASLISYSRIYLGVHYPSDVLAGAFIGIGCGVLMIYMIKRYSRLLN
jgi:undecaprenyl-diphosphatase